MLLTGLDILILLSLVSGFIRFGPKIWGALQVHGVRSATQSGCKLVAFTEFGMRHVNTFLVMAAVAYAWAVLKWERQGVDRKVISAQMFKLQVS